MRNRLPSHLVAAATLLAFSVPGTPSRAQTPSPAALPSQRSDPDAAAPSLRIDLAQRGHPMPPRFYGLMTEEINHSYDGGLYAELIQNRSFQDQADAPAHWSLVQRGGSRANMTLDRDQPLTAALPVSLRLDVTGSGGSAGIANDGYWGVPIRAGTEYRASFYAKAAPGFNAPLRVALESADGDTVYAHADSLSPTRQWKRYALTLKTAGDTPSQPLLGRFAITSAHAGTVWIDLVSLLPPTYKDLPNGFRPDLMEKLSAMRPAFLRLPGGNYLEGNTVAERYDWKKSIGPLDERPGHESPWGYRSSDGLGLLEYLEWCEQLDMEPLLAVYAGYSLGGEHVDAGPSLQPYVQDALDEIEYVTGGTDTKWGAERARDGHPKPFPLSYVEVGNEDFFDKSRSYPRRFAQFQSAIKAKYPNLQIIASTGGQDYGGKMLKLATRPDVVDEHYYESAADMESDANRFDTYDRGGPKVFVGEWAAYGTIAPWSPQAKSIGPTSTFGSALSDAAWLTGLERNSDIVIKESYAPLFVNVNPGASQWRIDLIGYDALSSFGSPSYYVQALFAQHHGDTVLPAALSGGQLYASVTRDCQSKRLYIHLVNTSSRAQPLRIDIAGAASVADHGTAYTLTGGLPDVNTLASPAKIAPTSAPLLRVRPEFTYTAPPESVTVLDLGAR